MGKITNLQKDSVFYKLTAKYQNDIRCHSKTLYQLPFCVKIPVLFEVVG